ncbi:MAG: hypothetical protein A2087_11125 [Spirochaetes bacterium GWD1_61_31]|nr:MAG: hypothetical protein A2Y37_09925 [Spirochaetes bacterium GWB1_60_80]OHD34355.1 MAG: hypothetical protein A2004_07840 [Spirochaetes bacterium GWC1_61_12]OHD43128.1 MAG: hypothetical protein A2087_11125 [Spirochaetes bacterium GWD1_61_31]OHD44262.1 MAG: hypothetical protein A2Y35_06920 [Spirochaetes bacterium GWE1_60_18]OHD60378.1 MAG: hypothetical protein A2Y32_00605 [Spirochaetes bacterium GWF1_60_12]HAP43310.1 hypothetical protein [Spirochaetaceae bacterium]
MPQLRDIEEFKTSLQQLGDEARILEQWGETAVDDPLPVQGISEDLAALMSDSLEAVSDSADAAEPPSPEQLLDADSAGGDFTDFLDTMKLDEPDALPLSAAGEEADVSGLFNGLDTADYQDEPVAADTIPPDGAASPDAGEFSLDAMDAALADFGSGDADLSGESTALPEIPEPAGFEDLSGEFGLGDEVSPATEPPSEPPPDVSADFSDLADFAPSDLAELAIDAAATVAGDDFGMADFDATDLAEPTGEVPDPLSATLPDSDVFDPTADFGTVDDAVAASPAEPDDFDSFDLGGGVDGTAASADDGLPSLPDLDDLAFGEALGKGGLDDLDHQLEALDKPSPEAENFSIDNSWGNDFNIPGFEMKTPGDAAKPGKPTAAREPEAFRPKAGDAPIVKPVDLSEEQVDALQDSLLAYPLNLRLAIEDMLANDKGTTEQQAELVWMLVDGRSARDAAHLVSRVFKRTIHVPAGYEKRTGAALEAEKGSLAWIFRHSILPALQVILLVAAGLGALAFLGYNFAFRPLYANHIYSQGYEQLEAGNYPQSRSYFERADRYWIFKTWYYRYAAGYVDQAQYERAAEMYKFIMLRWPGEKQAALDWARMESGKRFRFAEAERILQEYILRNDYFHRDALLLTVLNYLNWADFEEQDYDGGNQTQIAELLEKARLQLASLMENYGQQDGYLELFGLYLIRAERFSGTNNLRMVLPVASYYLANSGRSDFSADTLAEIAAYLIMHGQRDYVAELLQAANGLDEMLPELHTATAAWYKLINMPERERGALENAVFTYRRLAETDAFGMTPRRQQNFIRSMIRLSEMRKEAGEFLDTEALLVEAVSEYERALEGRRFRPAAEFGMAYSHLGDLYYEVHGRFPEALEWYRQAEANFYHTERTDYRRGYIYYDAYASGTRNYPRALELFYRAGLDAEASPYLLLATGNTLYQRGDWFAAQAYYGMLRARIQQALAQITMPRPQEQEIHNELVDLLMVALNNQGAAMYRISQRMGDPAKRAEAMYAFSESARYWDSLSRDQVSMRRSETRNLGYLNLDFVLHPSRAIDIGIYPEIPSDMHFPQ